MTQAPLITIGIALYNAEETIKRAITSALLQDWPNIEIVVVDDCSNDGSVEIVQALMRSEPRIRLVRHKENKGVAVTRNSLLAEARGEFIAFFDDDDESIPERLSTQYHRIVNYERYFANEAPVICHAARKLIYPDGKEMSAATMGQNESGAAPNGIDVARRILLGAPLEDGYGGCPTCSQMARLSSYEALGGFDPDFRRSEDTDFNIRFALAGGHFVGVARPLVIQNMTKTTEKSLAEEYRNTLILIEKHRSFLDKEGQFGFSRRWLDVKFHWLEQRPFRFVLSLALLIASHPRLTFNRLVMAMPNISLNRRFSLFHKA